MEATVGDFRELRLLVDLGSDLRKLAKVAFSKSDASLYLFPYAPHGRYYFGGRHMDEVEFQDQVKFSDDPFSETLPKLSIHETGQIHIQAGALRAGPVSVSPLARWKGQHIASIGADSFESLPAFTESLSTTGPAIDHVIPTDQIVHGGRLVFFLAGDRPAFEEPNCRLVITLRRTTLSNPICLGIQPKAQRALSEPDLGGVTAIAGWDVDSQAQQGVDYLYIRGV
jgi:hypothetical protein